jgi:hypothetical protein
MTAPDPTGERILTVAATAHDDLLFAGFRQEWISGVASDDSGVTFDLTSGAGLGSPYLTVTLHRNGTLLATEVVDVRDLVVPWVNQILKGHD